MFILNMIKKEKYLLQLNRTTKQLDVYQKAENSILHKYYSIRPDFDSSDYTMYEKIKSMDCIFGGEKSPTPSGIFKIEKKSTEEYISGYYPDQDRVKFFGYLVVFEDYFIHSDLYGSDVMKETMKSYKPVSQGDTFTSGCIRVSQENLEWLLQNIETGSTVIM